MHGLKMGRGRTSPKLKKGWASLIILGSFFVCVVVSEGILRLTPQNDKVFGSEDTLFEEVLGEDFAWSFRFAERKSSRAQSPNSRWEFLRVGSSKEGIERNYVTKLTSLS